MTHLEKDTAALSDLFKLYVEMANAVSQRRDNINKFFLTLTTAIPVLVLSRQDTNIYSLSIALPITIIEAAICGVWLYMLFAYKRLNKAKFDVILDLEQRLPYADFDKERKTHEGPNLTDVEKYIPIILMVVYIAYPAVIVIIDYGHCIQG